MKLLIDTNVLMDALSDREPFSEMSTKIVSLCSEQKAEGYFAMHTISTLFYLLHKYKPAEEIRKDLYDLCRIMRIAYADQDAVMKAIKNDAFRDFEDCLQAECAKAVGADYIITRNTADFADSPVPAVTPADFLSRFDA